MELTLKGSVNIKNHRSKYIFLLFFIVSVFISKAQIITTIAGTGTLGYIGDGGQATSALLNYPKGVAYDLVGNVYISDSWNNVIRKINPSGIISTIAGNGTQGNSGNGGPATSAQLYRPYGVVAAPSGEIYFSDTYNNCVRKISVTGVITLVAGNSTQGYSGDGGAAINAQLYRPFGLAIDASGDVIIADCFNNVVRKVNSTTGIITTIAGTGTAGFSGDGGLASTALLAAPSAVALDAAGNIFIADYSNNRIRKINSSNIISTFAGNGTGTFAGDGGPATSSSLWIPTGVGVDGAGNVYISDHNNARIRKVNTSGTITTVAGNGSTTVSGDGGPAILAGMTYPEEIAVDPAGNIYSAESSGYRIRKVTASTTNINDLTLTLTVHGIDIYPNPCNDLVTINSEKIVKQIDLYSITGTLLLSQTVKDKVHHLQLQNFAEGIYFVKVSYDDGTRMTRKIIKQ